MPHDFKEVMTSEAQIRDLMGMPSDLVVASVMPSLDEHSRAFIANSPFVLIGSADSKGNVDVSPKGDPPGFVQVLDNQTLAIPDRIGNRRFDTFRNILENPKVGLIFLIPGKTHTLRVTGTAKIVRDTWLRETMTMQGKLPDFALVVTVMQAYVHCPKCMVRSKLWDTPQTQAANFVPSMAQMLVDQAKLPFEVDQLQALLDGDLEKELY